MENEEQEMHAGQKLIINTLQTAINKQSKMERKAELFDEMREALKVRVGWDVLEPQAIQETYPQAYAILSRAEQSLGGK